MMIAFIPPQPNSCNGVNRRRAVGAPAVSFDSLYTAPGDGQVTEQLATQGRISTKVPFGTDFEKFRISQLYKRTQPWLAQVPMLQGSSVPWM